MIIESSNTSFVFLFTSLIQRNDDTRHIIDLLLGVTYITNQYNDPEIIFFLDDKYHSDFNNLKTYFGITYPIQLSSSTDFNSRFPTINSDNIFLFISGHGNQKQIDSTDDFEPKAFFNTIQKNNYTTNTFIFFGQCFAGNYKNLHKINNKMTLYLFGSSDEYFSHSSSSLLSKGQSSLEKKHFKELIQLYNLNPELKELLASNLFLLESYIHLNILLNHEINEENINTFFTNIKENQIIDHLESNIYDDNKLIELLHSNNITEYKRIKKIMDDAYGQRNLYKEFLEFGKLQHPIVTAQKPDGTKIDIDVYLLFKRIIESIPKKYDSRNLPWFEKI